MFLFACQTIIQDIQSDINTEPVFNTGLQEPEVDDSNKPVEISMDSIEGITSDEAVMLCREVFGDKHNENSTFGMSEGPRGIPMSYLSEAAVEYKGTKYYCMRVMWLPHESTWSTIGFLLVSADGNEIHSGMRHSDGTYSLGRILWEK